MKSDTRVALRECGNCGKAVYKKSIILKSRAVFIAQISKQLDTNKTLLMLHIMFTYVTYLI